MKKSALVYCGNKVGYKVLPVDVATMTKSLVFGRICYVLNDVKTFPSVDVEQDFGTTTKENVWIRFSFDCSARVDLRELVRYAVGCDRFGGLPLRFKSHSGKLTITTCRCGKLAGASKFLLRAMSEEAFHLNSVKIEFIDGNGKLPPKSVSWSRKRCEEFTCNTDITHAIQALRRDYSVGNL
jgi:hypothetical protein